MFYKVFSQYKKLTSHLAFPFAVTFSLYHSLSCKKIVPNKIQQVISVRGFNCEINAYEQT